MATEYEMRRRRSDFFTETFDEMVGRVIDLEEKIAELESELVERKADIAAFESERDG